MKRYIKSSDEYMQFEILYPDGSPIIFSDKYLDDYGTLLEKELQNYSDSVSNHHFDPIIMEDFLVKFYMGSGSSKSAEVYFSDSVDTYKLNFSYDELSGLSEEASKNGVNNLQEICKADAKIIYDQLYKTYWATIKKDLYED